jgi:hypothetical protein
LTLIYAKRYNRKIAELSGYVKGLLCMNSVVTTYIGLGVAGLILLWGFVEIGRRYFRQRHKVDPTTMQTWVPLKPVSADSAEDTLLDTLDEDQQDEISDAGTYSRAKQNGHYSESKKLL